MNRTLTRIRRWLFLLLFVGLLGGSIAWRVGQVRAKQEEQAKQRTAARGRVPTVAVAPVVRHTLEEAVEELVSLRAPLNVNVAAKVSGRILTLKHFEGDSVRAGEELILIDPEELEARVREARASLHAAERRLQQARIGEQPQRSQVTAAIEQAQTELDTAKAELRQVETSVDSRLATAKTTVAQTKARLDNEELQLRRLEQLLTRGFVPAQDVDSAKMRVAVARADQDAANERVTLTEAQNRADVDVARESVKRAAARLKVARANQAQNPMYMEQIASVQAAADEQRASLENAVAALKQTRILAPISGFVTSRLMDPGAMATPGQPILTLVDIRTCWAEASFSEEQASKIRVGSVGEVTLDGIPGQKFRGRVIQVNPAANVQSRAFTVRVELPNPELRLKPGMFGRVRFVVSRTAGALTIPTESVLDAPSGEHLVWLVEDETARRVPITVGASREGITEVLSGLSEGQSVITMGYDRLRDGAKVRPGPARGKP
jgi:membrane fusion protein (multidrug efflux system)